MSDFPHIQVYASLPRNVAPNEDIDVHPSNCDLECYSHLSICFLLNIEPTIVYFRHTRSVTVEKRWKWRHRWYWQCQIWVIFEHVCSLVLGTDLAFLMVRTTAFIVERWALMNDQTPNFAMTTADVNPPGPPEERRCTSDALITELTLTPLLELAFKHNSPLRMSDDENSSPRAPFS